MSNETIPEEEQLLQDFKFILQAAKETDDPDQKYTIIQQAIVACEKSQEGLSYETLEWVITMAVSYDF